MPKQKSVSLFKIYFHFFEPIDWLFLFLAIIGAIGAGMAMTLMLYIMSKMMGNMGDTSENRDTEVNIEMMEAMVDDLNWNPSGTTTYFRWFIFRMLFYKCLFLVFISS